MSLAVQVIGHDPALVSRQAIPDQYDFLTPHFTSEVFEKSNETIGVVATWPSLKEHLAAAAIPAISDCRTNRELLPIKGVNQDGLFPFWRSGTADGGTFRDAALVLEEDPCFPAASVFFTAGHLSFSQSRTFPSSRCRACLAGRCKVQSMDPKIFHTWPG